MTSACESAGFTVTAVARVAEIERWPTGQVVVTDTERFSEMWKRVGATHVLVLSSTASEGIDACARGASAWIPRLCSAEALVAVLLALDQGEMI